MNILGIESSSLVAGVALVTENITVGEYTVDFKKTHSQTLLPMLDELVKLLELDLSAIDAIAVAGGPGSFTGLRIGAATAKGLGLALKKPLIHVPAVDAMAYNMWGAAGIICPIMDARRSQVYTGLYRTEESFEVWMEQCPMDVKELCCRLNREGEPVIFLGDGVPVYRELIGREIQVPYRFAPPHMNRQRAAGVAALGLTALEGDVRFRESLGVSSYTGARMVSPEEFAPDYLRKPQAERQREAEEAGGEGTGKLPGDY